ncbi:DUF4886 domain-containing protein [Aurantibacter sp.]|uniref:DUF4886 domain-containing protein n=1 Tax=Aurantibacter sp. TaxID=2807103 RepID=UPI0032676402
MRKNTFKYCTLIFAVFFFLSGKVFSNGFDSKVTDTVRILTIGNSFANNASKYLKEITASVKGVEIIIGKANIGGCNLEKHANLIKQCEQDSTLKPYKGKSLKEWLLSDDWNVVTMQQVSHLSFKAESYQPFADEIRDFISKHAPQAKIYIHQTWAYAPDSPRLVEFGITMDQMYIGLEKNYEVLSKHFNSPILTSGNAFYRSIKKREHIDLWNPKDRFHANENGCYLAACIWFKELFGKSPKKIKYGPDELSKKTARYLRRIAAK